VVLPSHSRVLSSSATTLKEGHTNMAVTGIRPAASAPAASPAPPRTVHRRPVPIEVQGTTRQLAGLYRGAFPGVCRPSAYPSAVTPTAPESCASTRPAVPRRAPGQPLGSGPGQTRPGESTLTDHMAIGMAAMGYRILVPATPNPTTSR
jgi:hypothetical protein